MSQNSGSSSGTSRRERIIPIQTEAEKSQNVRSSPRLSTKREQQTPTKHAADGDTVTIGEECNSAYAHVFPKMSQSPGTLSNSSRKERIIPIQMEEKISQNVRSSPRLSTKHDQQTLANQDTDTITTINEDSNSTDEGNVCTSINSLTLASDKEDSNVSGDASSIETVIDAPQRLLPSYNVPEKIIIVLDRALDDNYTSFEMMSGKKYSPLFMLQHAIKIFLHNKAAIDNQHEFALLFLNENSTTWIHDFTNSPHDIIHSIQSVTECQPEDIFDLNAVFDLIYKKIDITTPKKDLIPPLSTVRVVLLYGRSYSIPQLTKTETIENLLNSPYFTLDVIMTHEPPSSANHCNRIFKTLQEIDTKGFAYSFSVSRNASDLHVAMAKILSHPLQRPHQLNAKYNINLFK